MIRDNTKNSCFIYTYLSEIEVVDKATSVALIDIADSALFTRDFKLVDKIAAKLRDPFAAAYFSNCDPLLQNTNKTSSELEKLTLEAPLYFRVRALNQLAARKVMEGSMEEADSMFAKSLALCPADDPVRWQTLRNRGVLLGSAGEQKAAIGILRSVCPAAWELRHKYPAFYLDTLNNLAYELFESGRLDEAESLIARPLSSPFLGAYPAWASTAEDIAKEKAKQSVKLFLPSTYRRPKKKKTNVVALPVRKAVIEAVIDNSTVVGQLIPFIKKRLLTVEMGEICMQIVLDIIDGKVDNATLLKIHRMILRGKKKSGS